VGKISLKIKLFGSLTLLVLLSNLQVTADVVILKDGKVITGNVLQQDDGGALIQMDYGTFRYRCL
jgi:hypothetical protein